MHYVDDWLNTITMYRLVVYGLGVIAAVAVLMSLLGILSFSVTSLIWSAAVIMVAAYLTNRLFAAIWDIPTNSESWLITSLILFLILQPAAHGYQYAALALAGVISSASKFVVGWRGKHIFNPAALAASIMSLTALTATSWWVGSAKLWPFTLVVGLLIVRKIRRFPIVLMFAGATMVLQFLIDVFGHHPLGTDFKTALISSPLIFLATIMLTEPATMPPRRREQLLFAALVALLYTPSWHLGSFYVYPEVALLLANLYAFAISPKRRLRLELTEIQRVSDRVFNYVFRPDVMMPFLPGQYLEWTLPGVPYDSRGNRRTFTIASSPTEDTIQLGLKYYEPASAFKTTFHSLQPGDVIYASQLSGNFTLQGHEREKLVFIAGGIGITPFRSMIKYFLDTGTDCDIVLIYLVSDPQEAAYHQEFVAARQRGLQYLLVNTRATTYDGAKLRELVPDYGQRRFFVSGPHPMVESTQGYLRQMGVPRHRIKTDHFSGY